MKKLILLFIILPVLVMALDYFVEYPEAYSRTEVQLDGHQGKVKEFRRMEYRIYPMDGENFGIPALLLREKVVFRYDPWGNRQEVSAYNFSYGNPRLQWQYRYDNSYDAVNRIIKRQVSYLDDRGKVTKKDEYQFYYNKKGELLKMEEWNGDYQPPRLSTTWFNLDDKGRLVSVRLTNNNEAKTYQYQYNTQGKVIRTIGIYSNLYRDASEPVQCGTNSYTYNPDGKLILRKQFHQVYPTWFIYGKEYQGLKLVREFEYRLSSGKTNSAQVYSITWPGTGPFVYVRQLIYGYTEMVENFNRESQLAQRIQYYKNATNHIWNYSYDKSGNKIQEIQQEPDFVYDPLTKHIGWKIVEKKKTEYLYEYWK